MKTKSRVFKAVSVILLLGLSLIYNMDYQFLKPEYSYQSTEQVDDAGMAVVEQKNSGSKIYTFTKSIFISGIKQIISNH
ncbi:MAG: hypothetical protein LLF95_02360 [Bacteroidales bacterium]|nr:hypothetical protein [Bacteroidales bacterium]